MWVTPAACSVAAVVRMMQSAISVREDHADIRVELDAAQVLARLLAAPRAAARGPASARCSSTSCEACQKKRYGLMVVPSTATSIAT